MQGGDFEGRRPSRRSRLYAAILRRFVKPALARVRTPADIGRLRATVARVDRWLAAPARGVRVSALHLPGCEAEWIVPAGAEAQRVILYAPGGAFVVRTPRVHRALCARIARAAKARVLLVFYRLAPEHPFPAGRDDVLAAYRHLLDGGTPAHRIVMGGDSAGGSLVLATLFALRDRGVPLPSGAFLLSPSTDLRPHLTGSRAEFADIDAMLSADNAGPVAESYVGADRARLLDAGVSPVLGDYRGLPPLLIQVGSQEILLDDAREAAARASEAGVPTELEVWPGMPHVFQAFAPMPESRRAIARIAAFIERRTAAREAPMLGLMQDAPLLISSLIRHADRHHGSVEIVSRRVEGDIHRYTWRDVHARAKRVANALGALGIRPGDRVATLAWNGYRHLELYFGVSGCGAVMHTINPRLAPDQVRWIAGHAEDRVLFFDITFLPVLEKVAPQCQQVKTFVLMADRDLMPASTAIPNLLCYEDLLAAASPDYQWPVLDENAASSICFTSGTTGNPKGVVYSHRSTMLHTLVIALPDSLHLSASETILPVVPMFHVNAWGIPYAAAMVGAKLVFPGPALDGKSLHDLMESERVTLSAGVPTVWQGLLAYMEQNGLRFSTMRRTIIGGAALPPAMLRAFEERFDVEARHAWGMTEMSPVGTVCAMRVKHRDASPDELFAVKSKQGRAVFGVDMKIVDPEGRDLPWDGKQCGDLLVRGPWIVREYLRADGGDPLVRDADGLEWFPTGDVACIDADGYMQITDRSKDVIKSGGEWISSIDIENIALTHPGVAMAACIGVRHPKWDERPLLVVVRKPGSTVECAEILRHYEGKVAKWQVPDDVVFVDAIPLGATGKMQKNKLRDQFRDRFAGAAA